MFGVLLLKVEGYIDCRDFLLLLKDLICRCHTTSWALLERCAMSVSVLQPEVYLILAMTCGFDLIESLPLLLHASLRV
jgi:hypothetical protein